MNKLLGFALVVAFTAFAIGCMESAPPSNPASMPPPPTPMNTMTPPPMPTPGATTPEPTAGSTDEKPAETPEGK